MTDGTDYFSIADHPRSDLIQHCECYGNATSAPNQPRPRRLEPLMVFALRP